MLSRFPMDVCGLLRENMEVSMGSSGSEGPHLKPVVYFNQHLGTP